MQNKRRMHEKRFLQLLKMNQAQNCKLILELYYQVKKWASDWKNLIMKMQQINYNLFFVVIREEIKHL